MVLTMGATLIHPGLRQRASAVGVVPDGVRADAVQMPGTGAKPRRAAEVPFQKQADEPGRERHRPVGIRQYQVYLANHCPARRRNQSPRPGAGGFLYGVTLEPLRDPSAFPQFLAPVRQTEWVVYAKPPFGGPPQVIEYLGRYTHRVAISNQRLVALQDGQKVSFRWKDYRRPEQAQGNDGLRRGVHPPFPAACAAARLSAHPLLRLARQLPAGR